MLAASFFSLILPGLEVAEARTGSTMAAAMIAAGGIVLGVAAIAALNEVLPHEHFVTGREGAASRTIERIWLFVLAITIHNFPEGIAVGIGFAGGDIEKGTALAIGIGLQNFPEGLAVEPDPALERGSLRFETASGGVEDGPAHWRRAIAEAIAGC